MWHTGKAIVGAVAVWFCAATAAWGQIRITEYMYSGNGPEFFELTNVGAAPVDLTGWSYDDSSDSPGAFDLTALGTVEPGESVVITEGDAAVFAAAWGLTGVNVLGGADQGLGRNDQINVYDDTSTLADRLTYGDEDFPGTIRTKDRSGWPCSYAVGSDDIAGWVFSSVGDTQSSVQSTDGDVGSPGFFVDFDCAGLPTGACCDDFGICEEVSATVCIQSGGSYAGDDTDCSTTNCQSPAAGLVVVTEYLYSGDDGEFIEFTNVSDAPVDMTGWSYDDSSNAPGTVDLSAFGVVDPGESVVLTEVDAGDFATAWGLSGVDIIGDLTANLGRNDEINLYDNNNALVDRLTYGDEDFSGTIRTRDASGWPCEDAVGNNEISDWFLSFPSDLQDSYASASGDVGNPGTFQLFVCEICGNGRVDAGEECDGGNCCTASCTFTAAGTECRAAADACDLAETCDGAGAECPDDVVADAGTVCRVANGACDVVEVCDGGSFECPVDEFLSASTECRASTGPCDPAEACSGVSPECPVDAVITQCVDGDGCCPAGCDVMSDLDCTVDAIPAVSEWGLLILALCLAVGIKLKFGRRSGYST